jgi:predicted AAA+ superfamily ATPase
MIDRNAGPTLKRLVRSFPVVTVTGPRQSGKTTLCRMTFPDLKYVSLETPSTRSFAMDDPEGFLKTIAGGAVVDEIQRAPELTSYLQGAVDENPQPGRFILTGSRNFSIMETVSQSLAGRTGLLELLPFDLSECRRFPAPPMGLFDTLLHGGYPPIHDRQPELDDWMAAYVGTYIERDVRQILNVGSLLTFQTFVKLCAGRCGQLVNLSGLGADAGVDHKTAQAWLSVLEASYIAWRLPPWHGNLNKRLVRTPKLYFTDTGLMCSLLGIRTAEQLITHPLRGAVFENWVLSEIRKQYANLGRRAEIFFYRDRKGHEVDLLIPRPAGGLAVEVKSSQTFNAASFSGLEKLKALPGFGEYSTAVVYGGEDGQERSRGRVVPWWDAASLVSS